MTATRGGQAKCLRADVSILVKASLQPGILTPGRTAFPVLSAVMGNSHPSLPQPPPGMRIVGVGHPHPWPADLRYAAGTNPNVPPRGALVLSSPGIARYDGVDYGPSFPDEVPHVRALRAECVCRVESVSLSCPPARASPEFGPGTLPFPYPSVNLPCFGAPARRGTSACCSASKQICVCTLGSWRRHWRPAPPSSTAQRSLKFALQHGTVRRAPAVAAGVTASSPGLCFCGRRVVRDGVELDRLLFLPGIVVDLATFKGIGAFPPTACPSVAVVASASTFS